MNQNWSSLSLCRSRLGRIDLPVLDPSIKKDGREIGRPWPCSGKTRNNNNISYLL